MNNNKTLPLVQGAMITSIYGVFAIINTYTGSAFDIIIAYIMLIPMMWYVYTYSVKYSISLYCASIAIIFICGNIMFGSFCIPTLLLGIFYGIHKKKEGKHMLIGLVLVSAIKNSISFFVFSGMTGISVYKEGQEIYQELIHILPFLKDIINVEISFILLWLFIFICEAYCVMRYGELSLLLINKKK